LMSQNSLKDCCRVHKIKKFSALKDKDALAKLIFDNASEMINPAQKNATEKVARDHCFNVIFEVLDISLYQ